MQRYRFWLAITWLIGGAIVILTMVVQTTLGHYGAESQGAWEWLLPNIVPTLTLVLGITVLTKPGDRTSVEGTRALFFLALGASLFYLVVLALPIFLQPLVDAPPLTVLRQSNLWLGAIQGLASTLLGVFFTRETPKPRDG